MFKKVLVANRGEIALRIIRACREMGIATVAVHSEADRNSLHVRFADESICIGPPGVRESYLNVAAILGAADITGAEAIHPGYGFLAENADFAEICQRHGFCFIGPEPEQIRLMGDKVEAKACAKKAGIPVVPGSENGVEDPAKAIEIAREIGFPIILKASMGGGGRGMKIVRLPEQMEETFAIAQAEATAAFGNGGLYVEKYFDGPRHVEVQILADSLGSVIHLGERDCSIQRRHQKIIEESPAHSLSGEAREKMCEMAVQLCRQTGYTSAGTAEFLYTPEGKFYFIEMNTRLQVEHPVTEMVTGVDIVKEQIRIAGGEKLRFRQEEITLRGHAIECRINAEHPETFIPSPGTITGYHEPGGFGVRVDSAAYDQGRILPQYDSLVAKVIVHGENREEAIAKMKGALIEMIVEGIHTNIPFHQRVLEDEDFRKGLTHTRFVEKFIKGG